ncbi:response regulator [Pelagicoccus sp. NFK12]|uniref:histidine kinase n=1 Tax=Pelagicoccus enzymogenes TaxID=2773457 RepID=A0A927F6H1_9BACT|nr:response regulator [Pelagicoccus enzymogenes]MBD5779342.1 response regulator [Pelagicoccus enzymogenes]
MRIQIRYCLMLVLGGVLMVAPIWIALAQVDAEAASVSEDANELVAAFNRRSQSVETASAGEALSIARAQLEAFASRAQSRTDFMGLSGLGVACFLSGLCVFALGLYGLLRFARSVDGDAERLKLLALGESGAAELGLESGARLQIFREIEKEFRLRMTQFDDWIERLNNDRTDALTELEKERFSLLERLSEKSKDARSAVDFSVKKGDFLATMSHEIRTPMNGVLAVADDLLSYDLDREISEKVEMIKLSGESLVRILDDVLDFSKIEAGKLDVKQQSFDFAFACNATYALFTALAKEKGLRYDIFIDPQVPQYLRGDSVRVRQVLANLLSNALKFTDEGGVTLTISKQTREREGLLMSVIDTGLGIDSDSFERLFEAFGQAETGLEEKGTGLGLAISKRLAGLMDGELTYRNNVPAGSVFDFWIPLIEGTPVEREVDLAQATATVENARILVVEDNRINQHVIESLLERAKHTVHLARNGLEALDLVDEFKFDLIFMDCLMPKLDGFETAKRIRSLPSDHVNRGVPIVALTANAFAHDRDLCFESGMNDFLAKPVKKETLLGAVNHYCSERPVAPKES